jgi:EmrB/QacA subfamily drug resistance transporter
MTHREVLEALSGLLLAMFVAMLSSTVVSNALPVIVADLNGTESGYTWVIVATLLALTATTPIWGKLADLFSKKVLVQVSLLVFVAGSLFAAVSTSMEMLISARVVQGVGVGGLSALVQIVIASIVPPRERGRYFGYLGAVFAVATVSGPLVGGLIVDTPWLGWRWCFAVGIPVAAVAIVVLQKTLHLPVVRRDGVKIDYLGAALIASGVSVLLIWVSLAGNRFDWASATTALMVAGGVLLLAAAVVVESRVDEPVIPLRLFKDRTIALASVASTLVGVAMFGATVFLSQFFQLAHGKTPTEAGLLTLPMVLGLLLSSIVTGRVIARTGIWKRYLVGGAALLVVGLALLATLDHTTSMVTAGVFMLVMGVGLGAVNQNLVLAVQNAAAQRDIGAASSLAAFFRTMGGSAGVSALGAVLGHQVATSVTSGLTKLGVPVEGEAGTIPDFDMLPGPVRAVFEAAYGDATGHVFLIAVPFALVALVCILLIREKPLRTTIARADELEDAAS